MHKLRLTSFFALAISFACAGPRTEENATPLSTAAAPSPVPTPGPTRAYPVARAQAVAEQVFGQTVHDPYRWLEDVKSPEVQTWMDAEDKLARAELAKLPGRDALAARLREVLYVETVTPPTRRGNRFFYSRRRADQEKAVIYFREGEQGQEQVLIDPNALSPDGSISLHGYVATLDGKLVAYSLHKNNADYGTLHVMNVATRTPLMRGCRRRIALASRWCASTSSEPIRARIRWFARRPGIRGGSCSPACRAMAIG